VRSGATRVARSLAAWAVVACGATGCGHSPSSPKPIGPGSGTWRLVFADGFGEDRLDPTIWRTCFWWATRTCTIRSNGELQLYNARDVRLQRGVLRLRARRRGVVAPDGRRFRYASGMAMTGGRKHAKPPGFAFRYGFVEARARVPKGKGLWPAFWMLPASYESRPEIDVMEMYGDSTRVVRMHLHYFEDDGARASATGRWQGPDFSAGWHTFAVDWNASRIVWYVDGVERWRVSDDSAVPDERMYLLFNLAVGGDAPGAPNASTAFPSYFDVDYVRVWRRV
jgi:beta-glucanase (GH16 family)